MRRFLLILGALLGCHGGGASGQNCCAPTVRTVRTSTPVVVQTSHAVPSIYVLNQIATPQGTTNYTASAYPDINLIDVNRLAAQALALQQASVEAQSKYRAETLDFVAKLVEIQRPIAEQIAKGQAAAEVLREAGLSDGHAGPGELSTASTPSVAQQFCGKCHVGDTAKAGFRLDQEFDAAAAIARITTTDPDKRMPPEGNEQPTAEQRLLLVGELLTNARTE